MNNKELMEKIISKVAKEATSPEEAADLVKQMV